MANFWTDGRIEPKRQNRWIVQFDGVHAGNMYFATKVTRPSVEAPSKEHKFLNHTFNYPGRPVWKPISLTMVDTAGGGPPDSPGDNTMRSLMQILTDSGYVVPNSALNQSLSTIAKNKAVSGLASPSVSTSGQAQTRNPANSIKLTMVNADGAEIEKWELKNAFITKIAPSELSYEDDGIATVDVEITYDYCVFEDTFFTAR